MHGATQMRCRVVASVDAHARGLDHVDRSRHDGEDGLIGRKELRQPFVAGLHCKRL